jgi:hypothetical protein
MFNSAAGVSCDHPAEFYDLAYPNVSLGLEHDEVD